MIRSPHGPVGRARSTTRRKRLRHIPGLMIIRVRAGAAGPQAAGLHFTRARAMAAPEAVTAPLDYLRRNAGLKSVTPLFSRRREQLARAGMPLATRARLAALTSVADSSNEDLAGINIVALDPRRATPALVKHLRASRALDIVELMPARWLQAGARVDPLQNLQWGLRAINWFAARRPPARAISVGVLDTGIDATHPDLRAALGQYHHDGLSARDVLGHGTHVSGIIAATINNRVGISGVARCRIVMWKIFDDTPAPDGEFYVDGERYLRALGAARDAGVRVVNLSIGGEASSQTEQLLFRRLEAAGVAVVAAMGNEYEEGNPVEYPGAYQTVLAVGAVGETLRRAHFSNTGAHIGLVAPGANILSTLPLATTPYLDETGYAAWSGTSMATPHVAGVAALVFARRAGWDAARVKQHLVAAARRLPAMGRRRWTRAYGAGLLDVAAALA